MSNGDKEDRDRKWKEVLEYERGNQEDITRHAIAKVQQTLLLITQQFTNHLELPTPLLISYLCIHLGLSIPHSILHRQPGAKCANG
jgi:hypothetical protein